MLTSQICSQAGIEALHQQGIHQLYADAPSFHRKQWEDMFLIAAAKERGLLLPGKRALGFAVGREVLPGVFANHGVQVLATDLSLEGAERGGWISTNQHSARKQDLKFPWCDEAKFEQLVSFRAVDMNAIPADLQVSDIDLTGFDFVWSTCSFEHLGSLAQGMAFVVNAMGCVRPGGWAFHTTEFNLSSNTDTLETDSTCIFRQRDMEELAEMLAASGCRLVNNFAVTEQELDRRIDFLPHCQDPHIRLQIGRYVATSYGLIIEKLG